MEWICSKGEEDDDEEEERHGSWYFSRSKVVGTKLYLPIRARTWVATAGFGELGCFYKGSR